MIPNTIQGVYPPLVLPLTEDRVIDFDSLTRQIEFLIAGGVHGIWINGTSGDFFHLTFEEKLDVIRHCQQVAGDRIHVISQIGDTSTRLAVRNAKAAIEAGAESLACCFPYYMEFTEEELKYHFRQVKQVAGDTPLFLYQLPQTTKVKLSVPGVLELAREGTIVGIKESSGNAAYFRNLCDLAKAEDSPLRIFMGVGLLADFGLLFNAHGVMAAVANLVPATVREMVDAHRAGDHAAGLRAQERINAVVRATGLAPRDPLYWAPTVALYKFILKELGVIATDTIFEPVTPLTASEKQRLSEKALPLVRAAQAIRP